MTVRLANSPIDAGVEFDDDDRGGYYWFLHPLFEELARSTGQYIDLYGNAEFSGGTLAPFRETFVEARRLVLERPARWDVHVGSGATPLSKSVDRAAFLEHVDTILGLAEVAMATGSTVVCAGD